MKILGRSGTRGKPRNPWNQTATEYWKKHSASRSAFTMDISGTIPICSIQKPERPNLSNCCAESPTYSVVRKSLATIGLRPLRAAAKPKSSNSKHLWFLGAMLVLPHKIL